MCTVSSPSGVCHSERIFVVIPIHPISLNFRNVWIQIHCVNVRYLCVCTQTEKKNRSMNFNLGFSRYFFFILQTHTHTNNAKRKYITPILHFYLFFILKTVTLVRYMSHLHFISHLNLNIK